MKKKETKILEGFLYPAYFCLPILYRGKSEKKQVSISLNLDFGNMVHNLYCLCAQLYFFFFCLLKNFSNAFSILNQTLLPTYVKTRELSEICNLFL